MNFVDGVASVRVPLGRYAVLGSLYTAAGPGAPFEDRALFTRDLDVSSDQTIELDAREGVPLVVETEKKAVPAALDLTLTRRLPDYDYPVIISTGSTVGGPSAGMEDGFSLLPSEGDLVGDTSIAVRAGLNQPLFDAKAVAGKSKLDVATDLTYG